MLNIFHINKNPHIIFTVLSIIKGPIWINNLFPAYNTMISADVKAIYIAKDKIKLKKNW